MLFYNNFLLPCVCYNSVTLLQIAAAGIGFTGDFERRIILRVENDVRAWVPDDTPKVLDPRLHDEIKYTDILECKVFLGPAYFQLTCIRLFGSDGKSWQYVALIKYYNTCTDKLVVASCHVKEINDSIFPPSNVEGGLDKHFAIRFRGQDKTCYLRKYVVTVVDRSTTRGKLKPLSECPSGENEKFTYSQCYEVNK